MVDVNDLKSILLDKFPIRSIIVQKSFPNTLSIIVDEKISTIIYDNGSKYSYLGLEGNIVEIVQNVSPTEWYEKLEIVTSTLADGTERKEEKIIERKHVPAVIDVVRDLGNYPIVYDRRGRVAELNAKVLQEKTVHGVIDWFNLIEKKTEIPFQYVVIAGEVGEATIISQNEAELRVNLHERVNEQFDELQLVLRDKVDLSGVSYIDLRYQGRVYWR